MELRLALQDRDRKLFNLIRSHARLEAKVELMEGELVQAKGVAPTPTPNPNDKFAITRKKKVRLLPQGVVAIGIRRNLGNVAAKDFGAGILEDISHQTVNRCEVLCGAALNQSAVLSVLRQLMHEVA